MLLRIEQGKGRRDRHAMLSPRLLAILEDYWWVAKPRTWLFPGRDPLLPITTRQLHRVVCTTSKTVIDDGRKRVRRGLRRPQAEWEVLITDHHEGYITWDEFERNQIVIANNATGKGSATRGAARQGELLLAGLLRCGHCGRKMYVGYGRSGRYYCQGANV